MNRVIKFRAWDKKANEWLFGYELPNLGGFSMFGEIMMMGEWASLLSSRFPKDTEEIEVMQYTGLHDKNGKEIYEGDIFKLHDDLFQVKFGRHSIGQQNGFYYVRIKDNEEMSSVWGMAWHFVVIGNIYENSDLLV